MADRPRADCPCGVILRGFDGWLPLLGGGKGASRMKGHPPRLANHPLSKVQDLDLTCFFQKKLLTYDFPAANGAFQRHALARPFPALSQFMEERRMIGSNPLPAQTNARQTKKAAKNKRPKPSYRPTLEPLEDRITPYVLSGYSWASTNISASFVPDGTWNYGYQSDLFALYNAAYPTATWQLQFAKALQTWADSSALNFHFVADDGSPSGTPGLTQGDPRFGDIRLGGYNFGAGGIVGTGWNPIPTTTGGDVTLNTYSTLAIGSKPDLYSVLLHETGHPIGFLHSLV